MKRMIAVLLAALSLLALSGCGSMFKDEYYYETPYTGDIGPRSDRATEVRNYNMLKTALTNMIVNHTETGELRFTNYNGSPSEDLAAACFEIKSDHPLGAYAVENMSYDVSYVVSYYMANIYIAYKRTAEELAGIVYSSDTADFDRNLADAADHFLPKLVIRCYDAGVDESYVLARLKRHYYDDPVTEVFEPEAEVTSYPAEGANRIFDIRFRYAMPSHRQMPMSMALSDKLHAVALTMTETGRPELALECAVYLTENCAGGDPAAPYAGTAYGALVSGTADSKGYALAYKALCQAVGIDCTVVEGFFGAMGGEPHFWNIIELDGEHYHVDLSGFADDPAAAFLRSDDALWGAYIWNTADYPACSGALTYAEVAGIPEPEDAAAEGEDGHGGLAPAATQTQEPAGEGTETPPPEETEPPASETPQPSPDADVPGEEPEPVPTEKPGEEKTT